MGNRDRDNRQPLHREHHRGGGGGNAHYIGELAQGGIIVYVWKDALNAEHGLVASVNDQVLYLDFLAGPASYPKSWYNCVRAVRKF